jgi:hypothetical protein
MEQINGAMKKGARNQQNVTEESINIGREQQGKRQ